MEAVGRFGIVEILAPFLFGHAAFLVAGKIHPVGAARKLENVEIIDKSHPEIFIGGYFDGRFGETDTHDGLPAAGAEGQGKQG